MDFVASVGGDRRLRVEENLGHGYVVLRVSEAERRQAKHDIRCVEDAVIEMLRNARDAGASHIFVATTREGRIRTVTVLDDGCGVPTDMANRIFDARVTSKLESVHMDRWGVHGRGMALFSIRENAISAEVMASDEGLGTAIRVITDADELAERADQSTWPTVTKDETGTTTVARGPHNIIRSCCEFALEEFGRCEVYLGSPAEIVATLRRRFRTTRDSDDDFIAGGADQQKVIRRPAACVDAQELASLCSSIGLDISERTAHRIMAGQIKCLRSVYALLTNGDDHEIPSKEVDLYRDRRGLKVATEDLSAFAKIMERDFAYLSERYYLTLDDAPHVRVANGRITVTFDLAHDD